ncbi:hypothetical protein KUV80_11455 [Fictibacillus nanhaiensis]|uniref:hypothetical protein n=1 Tax=Fictibacillus nanhaiensis TaxID=742169 RepID=UPI001C97DD5D|nr:hypothetical protein [Fictibacillus nanhaiensis]MBY6037277.1 hypothetical protein [Fictibacillus nanhaiensis]
MIKRLEFKKIITSPIVLGLFLLFLMYNLFLIYDKTPMKEDMNLLQPIIKENGTLMDADGRSGLQSSYEKELATWNKLAQTKTGDTYEAATDFYKPEHFHSLMEAKTYTDKELQAISTLALKETYFHTIDGIESQYNQLNMIKSAEEQIRVFGLGEGVAETVRTQYTQLDTRVKELITNKEHLHLFFHGKIYATHSFLFKTLFQSIIFQAMILIVLFTAFLVNYEFEQKTSLVAYSTKRGRHLVWDKLVVALLSSLVATFTLLGTTLLVYFLVFDYSGLWNVPISTGFLIELNEIPFISWWNFTFLEYLLLSCALLMICQVIFALLTFCLSMWIRNSYIVFTIFGVIFGAGVLLPGYIPKDNLLILYTHFSPFVLVMNVKKWWMESGAFTSFKHYEVITVSAWLIALLLIAWFSISRFTRENL